MLTKAKILTQTMVDRQREPAVLTCTSCKGLRMEVTISLCSSMCELLGIYEPMPPIVVEGGFAAQYC